jgi:nitrogen fixation/metabolism regulation signal transduction histidine kinase
MPHISFAQLTFVVATGLGIVALFILGINALRKAHRNQAGYADLKSPGPRVQDQAAYVTAAFQGIVKDLKEQKKNLEELLRAAEQRADASLRLFTVLSHEMQEGVVQISKEGLIVFANPAARSLLEMATLTHRLYTEVFAADTKFCKSMYACLHAGAVTRRQQVHYLCPSGKARPLLVSVVPLATRQETIEGAICLLREFSGDTSLPGHREAVN